VFFLLHPDEERKKKPLPVLSLEQQEQKKK